MKKVGKALFVIIAAAGLLLMPYSRNLLNLVLHDSAIDNTNHGWEIRRNHNHKQPDIPQNAREIINKYNGIYVGPSDKKVIYLTIDLGYESGNTCAILDVLRENSIRATFFIISSYLERNAEIVDRIVDDGHSLQNHTANYRHLNTLSDYQVKQEIMRMHNTVYKRYGINMKYLRLPYEDWSERVMKIASEAGYKTVFWSIACADWVDDNGTDCVYNNVMNNHHNGGVILLHAVSKSSPQAVDAVIKGLKGKRYEFRVLDI